MNEAGGFTSANPGSANPGSANPGSANSTSGANARTGENLCDSIYRAFRQAAETFGPPEAAARHFRDARKEVLLGMRAILDARIERLSRQDTKGTGIVVE